MPSGQEHPGASVHGRTQRAQAASMRPSISAATAKEKADREADIAEIEQRRMDGEAEILQDRVEVAAFERRVRQARERVGGDEDEQIEGAGDPRLHRQHMRLQRRRQIAAEGGDKRAEQRQDQHPQEHRALVVSPDAR